MSLEKKKTFKLEPLHTNDFQIKNTANYFRRTSDNLNFPSQRIKINKNILSIPYTKNNGLNYNNILTSSKNNLEHNQNSDRRSSNKSENSKNTFKSCTLKSNSPSKNKNIKENKNKKYSKAKKRTDNPFEVEDEDKIFAQLIKKKNKTKKKSTKNKLGSGIKLYKSALNRVYKKIPVVMYKLENIKKLKNFTNLCEYQGMLLSTGNRCLTREGRKKVSDKFEQIRKISEKNYNLFQNSLDSIEKEEKKIIDKINTQTKFFKKTMIRNNRANFVYTNISKYDLLPEIKFFRTSRDKIHKKEVFTK